MIPSIEAYLDTATGILAKVPGVASCAVARGRYTEAELAAASFNTPGLRLAVASIRSVSNAGDGQIDVTVRVGLALVTRDSPRLPRETAAVRLVDRLVPLLADNPWGLDWADDPTAIDGVNAHTGTVNSVGLMVWELGWDQPLRLGVTDPLLLPPLEAPDGD